jgi:hypothetical protein
MIFVPVLLNGNKVGDGETNCGECGKLFLAYRDVTVTWTTRKPSPL